MFWLILYVTIGIVVAATYDVLTDAMSMKEDCDDGEACARLIFFALFWPVVVLILILGAVILTLARIVGYIVHRLNRSRRDYISSRKGN